MRILGIVILLCLASARVALSQVSVEVLFDQEQYLQNEPLTVKVRITNFSGRTLHLGKDDDWLTFSVETRDKIVPRLGELKLAGEFALENATKGTKRVQLLNAFDVSRIARYSVTASVNIPELNQVVSSSPGHFDVISGTKLWDLEFGVPPRGEDAAAAPEIRKYALLQAIHLRRPRLYARVSDASEATIFRVIPLPPMVSFGNPERQVDKAANLHLIYQTGARTFHYTVVNPDGELLVRQTYESTDSRPMLRPDRDGRVKVLGGARRLSTNDLPVPVAAQAPTDAKKEQP